MRRPPPGVIPNGIIWPSNPLIDKRSVFLLCFVPRDEAIIEYWESSGGRRTVSTKLCLNSNLQCRICSRGRRSMTLTACAWNACCCALACSITRTSRNTAVPCFVPYCSYDAVLAQGSFSPKTMKTKTALRSTLNIAMIPAALPQPRRIPGVTWQALPAVVCGEIKVGIPCERKRFSAPLQTRR